MDPRDVKKREQEWTALMLAADGGDDGAYHRLLADLTTALRAMTTRGFARAGSGSAEVEDVVQETLLAVHLKRHTWDRTQPFAPWVTVIARNKLVDALRRRGRRNDVAVDDVAETLAAPPDADPTTAGDVARLLEQLKPRQRDIVRSIAVEDRSIRATAERLAMTEGAVRVALHRGLAALADLYRRGAP